MKNKTEVNEYFTFLWNLKQAEFIEKNGKITNKT